MTTADSGISLPTAVYLQCCLLSNAIDLCRLTIASYNRLKYRCHSLSLFLSMNHSSMATVKRSFCLALLLTMFFLAYMSFKFNAYRFEIVVFNVTLQCRNCSTLTMEDLMEISRRRTFPTGVPRIVHYNYKGRLVPSQYVPLVRDCVKMNPTVTFVLWSDLNSYTFIQRFFPEDFTVFQTYYQRKADPLKKSDLVRYFILLQFGGIYMDLDTRCQRPMDLAVANDSCILSREAEVQTRILSNYQFYAMNSFMACVANHSFFRYVVDSISSDDDSDILQLTGPRFLTETFQKYMSNSSEKEDADPHTAIRVAPSDDFSPFVESYTASKCKRPSGTWKVIGCKDITAYMAAMQGKIQRAIVVHLFMHLGYSHRYHQIKNLIDLAYIPGVSIIN